MARSFDAPRAVGKADKRGEILAVATDIFLNDGYGRASMDQVHARIGGSKRTLYTHFRNKEALFEAIIFDVSNRVLAALSPALDNKDLSDALLKMGIDYLNVLLSPEGLALYRAMISEAPHFPELARAFFENGPGRASRHLAAFFREQKYQGAIEIDDPQVVAEQFLGAVRGDLHLTATLGVRKPSKEHVEAAVSQVVDTFVRGIVLTSGKT
ncbi:TetR/AcrR family transcriptional regulator [Nitratireductor sp.]|uniref:TetR/AcrR family transcriptional regulator n=1 Tax=Nitratireductor sp. TaxID=1872084 RepID=UPI0025E45188|nr:TetR/AcrR family transcriptional regulator [Nitratireductor sp.]